MVVVRNSANSDADIGRIWSASLGSKSIRRDDLFSGPAGSDLDQDGPLVAEHEHRPLGDVDDLLAALAGQLGVEGDLADLVDELVVLALGDDPQLPFGQVGAQAAGGQRPAEHHLLGGLRDVDEAAGTEDAAVDQRRVDVAARSTSANPRQATSRPPPS